MAWDHNSPLLSAEVKNAWSYICTPTYVFIVWWVIKQWTTSPSHLSMKMNNMHYKYTCIFHSSFEFCIPSPWCRGLQYEISYSVDQEIIWFRGMWSFITLFPRALHWILTQATSIQSKSSHFLYLFKPILTVSSQLGSGSRYGLFPWR